MSSSKAIVRERHGDHDRLAYYTIGDAHTWDGEWQSYSPDAVRYVMEYYRRMSTLYPTLLEFLPKDGEILEAGSGLGFWVALLDKAGFEARGLDYSEEAVARARQTFPRLRFDRGDVRELPLPSASLSAYVSFGVAEHFQEGPGKILDEAFRVLRPGGTLILSVPWISPLRRLQPAIVDEAPRDASFYQYFFEREEFTSLVADAGFCPRVARYYGSMKTVFDVIRDARASSASPKRPSAKDATAAPPPRIDFARKLFWHAQNLVFENRISTRLAGHMMLLIAERP